MISSPDPTVYEQSKDIALEHWNYLLSVTIAVLTNQLNFIFHISIFKVGIYNSNLILI